MESTLKNMKEGSCIHLMGICGTAMASLAGLLLERGFRVTGSDENVYPPMSTQLSDLGISIMEGYKKENLDHRPDLVVVGNVISRHFEEAEALLDSSIPYTSLPRVLGEVIIENRHSVVVAGTHGKTTTTAWLAWMAETQGLQPGFFIGGVPFNFDKPFRVPQGEWFIIEGDEYDTAFFNKVPKFIYYRPRSVILTSIEFDHADIYSQITEIQRAFRGLVERIPPEGLLVAHADDPRVMEVAQGTRSRLVTFGWESGDYRVVDPSLFLGRQQFSVEYKGERVGDIAIKLFGKHNIVNAMAAYVLSRELQWQEYKSLQALADFKGVKRRQEIIGEPRGITVIEDFAHHPTAVRLSVEAMKERYVGRRLISVFEPRSATSRRNCFQEDYVRALKNSDVVVVPQPIGLDKIPREQRFSSKRLVEELNLEKGCKAFLKSDAEAIVDFLSETSQTGDVILIMSNGGFGGIYKALLAELSS